MLEIVHQLCFDFFFLMYECYYNKFFKCIKITKTKLNASLKCIFKCIFS